MLLVGLLAIRTGDGKGQEPGVFGLFVLDRLCENMLCQTSYSVQEGNLTIPVTYRYDYSFPDAVAGRYLESVKTNTKNFIRATGLRRGRHHEWSNQDAVHEDVQI